MVLEQDAGYAAQKNAEGAAGDCHGWIGYAVPPQTENDTCGEHVEPWAALIKAVYEAVH